METTMAEIDYILSLDYHISQQDAGQIVEVSYASDEEWVYKKTHDRSDGSQVVERSALLPDDEGDYWNGPPRNTDWELIKA